MAGLFMCLGFPRGLVGLLGLLGLLGFNLGLLGSLCFQLSSI